MGTRVQGSGLLFRGGLALLVLFFVSACTPDQDTRDRIAIEKAIDDIQSGAFIERLNDEQLRSNNELEEVRALNESLDADGDGLPDTVVKVPSYDPCPDVEDAVLGAEPGQLENFKEQATLFGQCIRKLTTVPSYAWVAYRSYKSFNPPVGTAYYSDLLEDQNYVELGESVEDRVQVTLLESLMDESVAESLRSEFAEPALEELLELAKLRREYLLEAEALVFAAMDAKPMLIEGLQVVDRYQALKVLRDSIDDVTGYKAAAGLYKIYTGSKTVPAGLKASNTRVIHPNALTALVPDEGKELMSLDRNYTAFAAANWAMENLDGTPEYIEKVTGLYRQYRDKDNPELPAHPPAAPGAARVVVMDTGADFKKFPELGMYMGNSQNELQSKDFSDGDRNPWMPALGSLSHGTGTGATVLTILGNHTPEVLRERKIELAFWKVWTLRNVLSGVNLVGSGWENRLAPVLDAVVERSTPEAQNEVQPDIVSVSLSFRAQWALTAFEQKDALMKSKWLWIMSAGNSGRDVAKERRSCFDDVPASMRPDSRILCVGALKRVTDSRGTESRVIAAYSNWGDRVEVYAYQTYTRLCPNGTSCSAPAITGAAAAVKARYPELTPEQVKGLILAAAGEEELEVESSNPSAPVQKRKVKVFDPDSMMPQLLKLADERYGDDVSGLVLASVASADR